jgi:hypothetical protein
MEEKLYWRVDGYYEVVWKPDGSHRSAQRFRFTKADWLNGFAPGCGREWPEGLPKVDKADLAKANRLALHHMRGHGYGALIRKRKRKTGSAAGTDQEALAKAQAIVADAARKQSLARYWEWKAYMAKAGRKPSAKAFAKEVEECKKGIC